MKNQSFGFLMMFVLFLICGAAYKTLTGSTAGYKAFQVRTGRGGGGRKVQQRSGGFTLTPCAK